MRTTIDLPDALYREAKLTAVARGISLKKLVTEGVAAVLQRPNENPRDQPWRKHAGTLSQEAADEMERFLAEADFSHVQPEDAA